MSQTQTQPLILILISGREHSLQSVEKETEQTISGLWMLISLREYALTLKRTKLLLKRSYKKPIPVLIELQNNILIYNFGKPNNKPLRFTREPTGSINVPHFRSEKLLTGNIRRSGDKMIWELKYIDKKYPTVIFEFQEVVKNTNQKANNSF
jgi:hypothetical protein